MEGRGQDEDVLSEEEKAKLRGGQAAGTYDTELDDEDDYEAAFFEDDEDLG